EEDARRACAALVRENNAYVDKVERKRGEIRRKAEKRRMAKARGKKTEDRSEAEVVKKQDECVAAGAIKAESPGQTCERIQETAAAAAEQKEEEEEEAEQEQEQDSDVDPDVAPIAVDQGYVAVPQMARVKDYVQYYRLGMRVAVRDREMEWWGGTISEIKSFRLRVHYDGFSRTWDEWLEMNTQRILVEQASLQQTSAQDGECLQAQEAPTQQQQQQQPVQQPVKRLGRPPKTPRQPAALTLPLALRRLAQRQTAAVSTPSAQMDLQAHGDSEAFLLPRSHMTLRDYSVLLQTGDKVEIRGRDKTWYASTIINVKHGRIRVCYDGHADEHNQWIAFNSERIRVLRSTVEADGRLARLHDEQWRGGRQRRQVERAREMRKKRRRVAQASLVRLAESMEYVAQSSDDDDMPLVLRMLEGGSEAADGMPLAERLRLGRRLACEQAQRAQQTLAASDSSTWFVYCNSCGVVLRTFRYYCTLCEHPSDGFDYRSFDLCLGCFTQAASVSAAHPVCGHLHGRTHFARAPVCDAAEIARFAERLLAQCHADAGLVAGVLTAYELDTFDPAYDAKEYLLQGGAAMWSAVAAGLHGTETHVEGARDEGGTGLVASRIGGYAAGLPRCAFCGSADAARAAALGGFAGGRPFLMPSARVEAAATDDSSSDSDSDDDSSSASADESGGAKKQQQQRRFWAHDACARASPEVLASPDGRWYNVAAALRRGRLLPCAGCRRRGATIGCFHARCQRSYHAGCTPDPLALCAGRLFWCPRHASSTLLDPEHPAQTQHCAACQRGLTRDLMWMECLECHPHPVPFVVCLACY
ncbi:hypothetical protein GGI05_004641, partial [Coemansia sp. RSA 2603]